MKSRAMLLSMLCLSLLVFLPSGAQAQEFRDIKAGFTGIGTGFDATSAKVSLGDYDHDGDLDVLLAGKGTSGWLTKVEVWRNDNGRYRKAEDFHGLKDSLTESAAWADIDKDGYFELITWMHTTVMDNSGGHDSGFVRLYGYDPAQGGFAQKEFTAPMAGVLSGRLPLFDFADIDHDGYPELLAAARLRPSYGDNAGEAPLTVILKNNAGASWTPIPGVTPVGDAVAAWGDQDDDGDLDLFISGENAARAKAVKTYNYDNGAFKPYATLNPAFAVQSAAWGDYDGDGLKDLVLSGGSTATTRLYWNSGTIFYSDPEAMEAGADAYTGGVSFGDIDGDGDPDLIICGQNFTYDEQHFTKIMTNNGGTFSDMQAKLQPYWYATASLADFDQDGNIDVILAGTTKNDLGQTSIATTFYRNLRGDFHPVVPEVDSLGGKRLRWGDFDDDGDLDLVACGTGFKAGTQQGVCRLYNNANGTLVQKATALDAAYGEVETGDLDGDGKLDVLLSGGRAAASGIRWFRNTGSDFEEKPVTLDAELARRIQHARLGDYDHDGKPDLAAWGTYSAVEYPNTRCYTGILRSLGGGAFAPADKGQVPDMCGGELAWGDYDRDGDDDLLFAGDSSGYGSSATYTGVFRNDAGAFVRTEDRFLGLSSATASWGDFDKDGDLDFVETGSNMITGVAGGDENVPTTVVYRLVGGRFEEYFRPGIGVIGDVAWLDYDNDGDLDLITSGRYFLGLPANINITMLYRNNGTDFTTIFLDNWYMLGALAVGDYDADGDADFAVFGRWQKPQTVGDGVPVLKIYRNTFAAPNSRPSAPSGLTASLGLASARLSWGSSQDAETPAPAMQYNLRIGTAPGLSDVLAPVSTPQGYRLAPAPGNAGHLQTTVINGLAPGTYYWSAQGVDKQLAGSPFSGEGSFTLGVPAPVLISAVAGPGPGGVTLKWNRIAQGNFMRYYLHYGTAADPVDRMDSTSQASDTAFTVKGLNNGETYHFRLSAVDQGGNVSAFSGSLTAVPDGTPPAVPEPVAAEPGDRAVTLTWKAATEADFLCYLVYQRNASGPIQKIDSITDIATVSKRIDGLKNGTPYGFLVVAVDKVFNHSGFSSEAVAIPAYLLTPSSPSIAFGDVHLGGSGEAPLRIANASDLPVAVDSVRFVNPAFSLTGALASLPAKAETTLTVRFNPGKPAGGDFTGVMKLYYGGAKFPLEIDLTGIASAPPYCRIDKITPAETPWDTAASLSFHSTGKDSDNAGEGDHITAYIWSSSLAGAFGENASSFTLKPSSLGIGAHAITLRVVDNEGDTSLAATASLVIGGRKPLARLEPITPAGLIIRGADRPRFRATAYDQDEGADAAHDSLKSFALMSTLQGLISSSKDTTLEPDGLALGLHGFYALVVDDEGDTARSDTAWVPVQTGVGMALLVAGSDFEDIRYFFENISPNCNWVYSKLRQRGFTDSLITYFNPVGWQSIGGAYHQNSNIVDETRMTRAALKERILGYKARVRNGVPLVISFVGHGSRSEQNGKFFLSPGESLTPDSLSAWLDTYNRDEEGRVTENLETPIVIVLDFCYSGTFLAKLRSSSQNRVVIASATAERQSYFQNGQSFSYAFFKQIGKGGNLAQAWAAGKTWSDANTLIGQERANPVADADNDNLPNETEDLARMSQIYIGGSQQDQSPDVRWKEVRLDVSLSSQTVTLRATAEGPAPVDTAWFTLLAPDFDYTAGTGDPFTVKPLTRQADGSFSITLKLEPVLGGEYMAIVYGLSGGQELMPATKRQETFSTLARSAGIPLHFNLGQNFPNPSAGQTWLPFSLTKHGAVSLTIMDMRGRVVRKLVSGMMQAGIYVLEWDGRDARGRIMPAGVYTFSLQSKEGTRRKKMVRQN
jgi:hypothetical protein